MSDKEEIGRVNGKNHTYTIVKHKVTFGDDLYCVVRDDDKNEGRFRSRADAYREAHEKAGSGAYES